MIGELRWRCGRTAPQSGIRYALARVAATALVLAALAGGATAEEPAGASTSMDARHEAARAIPLKKIDANYRRIVSEVVADPSLFRRMPTNVVDCQPELFTFLAENPEVLVEIWRNLGVSRVELTRTGPHTFKLKDGAGTTGDLVVVEQSCDPAAQNRIVMFAEGCYEGKPFSRPVCAKCVLLLRSGSMRETNGRKYVAARLDSFVKLDRASIELLAQAVHPFVGRTADQNFADTLSFVSNLSYTAENRPEAVVDLASELTTVGDERRERLADLAVECAAAGRQWQAERNEQASLETTQR